MAYLPIWWKRQNRQDGDNSIEPWVIPHFLPILTEAEPGSNFPLPKEIIKFRYVDNFCKRVYPRPAPAPSPSSRFGPGVEVKERLHHLAQRALVGADQGACAFVPP
jgi:hypothetical protein